MIRLSELVKDDQFLEDDHFMNLCRLHYCLNFIRVLYDRPMVVTSGYRSWQDHEQIYTTINIARQKQGKTPLSIPKLSNHLRGAAADIADGSGSVKEWVLKNLRIVEDLNLYFEDFDHTPNWVHIQIFPPRSNLRFFKP